MAQGFRRERVGDQIRAELADLLAREVHDPGIGFITITRVRVSADLQSVRVYYTTLGDARARNDTARALQRATAFLRHQIGQRLHLRRVPTLTFVFDEAVEGQDRIERIIQELHQQSAPQSDEPETDDRNRD